MSRSAPASRPTGRRFTARDGFTLIEVLVCLMLLSLLAAAVFPVVTQRVGRAEPVRAAQQLDAIRKALESFRGDLEGTLPGDIEDLSSRPDADDRWVQPTGGRRSYDEMRIRGWEGPYLETPFPDGGTIATGFDVPIHDDLLPFDERVNAPAGVRVEADGGDSLFLAVRLGRAGRQLTAAQFEAINDLIDGPAEIDGPGPGSSWNRGRFRFEQARGAMGGVGYYLAAPLRR